MPDTTPTITARSGVLLVVCAPSGTGKTTLIQRLRDEFPNFAYSISCTTRAPRGQYVFLLPPSLSELERRLRGRGTDDEASIARRLSNAASEIRQAHWFDAWIVNDNLDKAYDELRAVYLASTLHPAHRPGLANTILEG